MKTINLFGADDEVKDPSGPNPGSPNPEPPKTGAMPGTVTEEAAIGASGHTKINTIIGGTGISGSSGGSTGSAGSNSIPLGGIVDAKLAVNLMDAVLPSLLVLLLFRLGLKLRKSELQLTEKEKDTIAPILNRCLDTLLINFNNPWSALIVTLLTIYGSKVGEKIGIAILEKKIKKAEDTPPGEAPKEPAKAPTPNWQPSEELIKARMRDKKYPRKKAIEILKRMHSQSKIDDNGNTIQAD